METDKTVEIHIECGIVKDVINVPDGWEYVVIHHDEEGNTKIVQASGFR